MEFLFVFIGGFITIVSLLGTIAYFGILKEKSYDDLDKRQKQETNTKIDTKSKKKKNIKDVQQQQQSQKQLLNQVKKQSTKKQSKQDTLDTNESITNEGEEEEPMVSVPDPFTNKVFTRFSIQKREVTTTPIDKSNAQQQQQQQQQKEKPKAAIKPSPKPSTNTQTQPQSKTTTRSISRDISKEKKNVQHVQPVTMEPILVPVPDPVGQVSQVQQKQSTQVNTISNDIIYVNKIKTLDSKIDELMSEIHAKEKTIQMLTQNNFKLKQDMDKQEARLGDYDTLKKTNQIIQLEMSKMTQKMITLEKEKISLENKLKMFTSKEIEYQQHVQEIKSNLICEKDKLAQEMSVLKTLNEQLNNDLNRQLNDKDDFIQKLNEQIQIELNTKNSLNKSIIQLNTQLNEFKHKSDEYLNEINILKTKLDKTCLESNTQLDAKNTQITQMHAELVELNKLKRQIEINSDKELNEIKLKSSDEINALRDRLNKYLKEQQEQNAKYEQLNTIKLNEENQFKSQINELKTRIIQMEDVSKEKEADCEKLDKIQVEFNALMTKTQELEKQKLAQNELINELHKEIDTYKRRTSELEDRIEKQESHLVDNSKQQSIETQAELDKHKKQMNNLRSQLENAYNLIKEREMSIDVLTNQLKTQVENDRLKLELQRELKERCDENEKLKLSNVHLKDVLKETEKNINELEDTVQNREKTLLNEISDYKLKLQKIEKDNEKMKKELNNNYLNNQKLSSLIKFGQNAFEKEKSLMLKLDEQINHLTPFKKLSINGDINGEISSLSSNGLNGNHH